MKTTHLFDIPTVRSLLAALYALSPAITAADTHGQGASQYRNGPFNEFDLMAIGIALAVVLVVFGIRLGIRAVRRGRS
jgi:hypothetical protein